MDEMRAAAINADPNEFAGDAFWLVLLIGIWRNEILAAKWADTDWDNQTLFLGKTKNGEPVLTSLSRATIARLKSILRIKDNPFIICGAASVRKRGSTTGVFMICDELSGPG